MRLDAPITTVATDNATRWSCDGYTVVAIRREYLYLIGLLFVSAIVLFYGLDTRALFDIDEGMHAVMAQNMVLSGDWVTPTFNGEPFFDKPALVNWITALSFTVFGFTEFAARLPSAAAGLGCVILTFVLGRRTYGPMAGILAALILATSLEFIVVSRMVQYDIPFTLFTTASMLCFCYGIMEPLRRRRYFRLFYVAAALATLTKGPLGLFLPALAIALYIAYLGRWRFVRQLELLPGLFIYLLIVTPWTVAMEHANPGYLKYFLEAQHIANVFGGLGELKARHPQPLYYYVPVVIAGLFPWSITLLQALRRAPSSVRGVRRSVTIFLVIWFAAGFAFFSLAASKLSTYVLPLFPAAALLMGRFWQTYLDGRTEGNQRSLLIGAAIAFLVTAALAAYTVVADPWIYWEQERGLAWPKVEVFALMLAVTSGLAFAAIGMRNRIVTVAAMTVVSPIAALFALLSVAREAEPYNSAAEIGMEYGRLLPPGEKMVFSPRMLDSALFYSRREATVLDTEEALAEHLQNDDRVFVLLSRISKQDSDVFDGDYYVVRQYGNKAIVSNRPNRDPSELPEYADGGE